MRRLKYIKFYENYDDEYEKKSKNIQKIIDSYLECALWTNEEELKEQDSDTDLNINNFEEDSLIKTYLDIKKFLKIVGFAVDNIDETDIGHDLWLTRNGHGAGFFDRGYEEEREDVLVKAARSLGSVNILINDEGKLFIM